jgi:uracil-DNA glycosylase
VTLPDPSRVGPWADLPFFEKEWPRLRAALAADPRPICPLPQQVFAALERTRPDDVRVVILGQDPYPTPGHAHGFAFSVAPETQPLPRSLANIFTEMKNDIGNSPPNGDLTGWADQGVLLLNTALTVPAGEAGGHLKLGWDGLLGDVLARLDAHPRAFLLWGRQAQARGRALAPHHLKLETAHPSPLSARRGFFGSRPFSRVNDWLESRAAGSINWALSETGKDST